MHMLPPLEELLSGREDAPRMEDLMKKESVDNNVHTSSFHRCSLRVNNFFCLKDVYCDFKNINVIIGPQAAGKSLLIKLVALFMSVLQISHLFFTIEKFNKRLLKKIILNYFNSIFSDEYWVHKNFEIEFKYNEFLNIYEEL